MFLIAAVLAASAAAAPSLTATATATATSPSADAAAPAPADPCTTMLAVVTRPSVTTSPCSVKPNHAVIETGYQNTTADGTNAVAQYPQTLVRVGTRVPNLEISVAPPQLFRSAAGNGSADTAFGFKYELGYGAKWLYAVNAFVTVPTGLAGYGASGSGYTANIDLNYTLTPGISVAGTFGVNDLAAPQGRYTSIVPSLVASGMLSPDTTLFGEIATFSHAVGPLASTRVQYLIGLQHAFANRLQIDLEAGRSPTVATGAYRYLGAGLSYSR